MNGSTPARRPLDWLLEAAALSCVLFAAAHVWGQWADLPARVPTHFGADGAPNRWGSSRSLAALPAAAFFVWLLLGVAGRFPGLMNLPFTVNRRDPRVRALLFQMAIALKAAISAMFAYLTWAAVETGLGRQTGLGGPFLPATLGATLGTTGYYLWKLSPYRPGNSTPS